MKKTLDKSPKMLKLIMNKGSLLIELKFDKKLLILPKKLKGK